MTAFVTDLAVKGTLLLVLAFVSALALRRASAAARHLHWQLALAGLLALPLVSAVTPRLAVPAGPLAALLAPSPLAAAPAHHAAATLLATHEAPQEPRREETRRDVAELARATASAASPAAAPAAAPRPRDAARATPRAPIFTFRFALSPLQKVLAAWAAGAALVLALLGVGLLRARALSLRATPVTDPAWLSLADRVRRELSLHRTIELRRLPGAAVPMTFGWRRPVVLLPADADHWNTSRRRHVLLHELAHVRRGDWLGQIVAQATCAAWWWQPLTWIAARELRRHREAACDDAVLCAGNRASEYADDLLAIASSRGARLSMGAATLAMARRSQLEGRLLAVLEGGRRRAGPTPRRALIAGAATAALVTALACVQPKSEPAAPRSTEPQTITYSVTDAAGQPVPDAQVSTNEPEIHLNAPARAPRPPAEAPTPRVPHIAVTPSTSAPDAALAPEAAPAAPSPGLSLHLAQPARALEFVQPQMSIELPGNHHLCIAVAGDGDSSTWSWSDGDDRWTVEVKGSVSPDETGTKIGSLDDDASFVIEHAHGDATDRVEARGAQDEEGNDVVAWNGRVGGQDVSGDPARDAADKLMNVALTHTELFASERVNYLVEHGGASHALETIRALPADFAREGLLRCLITEHELDTADFAAALDLAAQGSDGDSTLAEMLESVGPDAVSDPDLVEPLFHAVEHIESDSRQAEVLQSLLGTEGVESPAVARGLRAAAAGIESDSCAADVLRSVPAARLRDPAVREAWLAVLATIESDAEMAEVLQGVIGERAVKGETAVALLNAATKGLDSDSGMADLLKEVPARTRADASVRDALLAAFDTIESDAEASEVAVGWVSDGARPEFAAALLAAAAKDIDSDTALAEVLQAVPDELLEQPAVRAAYEAALGSLQSASCVKEARERLTPRKA